MEGTFKFFECFAIIRLTGRRASDILEFLEILKQISPEAIFHHMHQYFLKPHIIPPEFPNDFAVWADETLGERNLAEALANVNPFEFASIEDLRAELVRIIAEHLKRYPPPRPALPGREFLFNEAVTIVLPTGIEAASLHDFIRALKEVDSTSIYFHFYEARLRLGRAQDDISRFLDACLDCPGLASRIKSLDPYMYSTEVLRNKIIKIVEEAL
ncbi:MAG: DUF5752 family protein [Deltaproteobacteria bacterium]|nr:DUF5752 family protein [Deltaproteobacteria bacterium]